MLLTRNINGYSLWDVPKGVEPWQMSGSSTWKFSLNEYYQYCCDITKSQAGWLLNGKELARDKFVRVETSVPELLHMGLDISFMSRNPWDHPERFPQFDRVLAAKRMVKYGIWRTWFAWYPVRIDSKWVWLQFVKRISTYDDDCVVCWEYRYRGKRQKAS